MTEFIEFFKEILENFTQTQITVHNSRMFLRNPEISDYLEIFTEGTSSPDSEEFTSYRIRTFLGSLTMCAA